MLSNQTPCRPKPKMALVLLAAGLSSRFGEHKLLHQYKNKALLNHTLDQLKPLLEDNNRLFVVTGHQADKICAQIEYSNIGEWQEAYCVDYAKGLGHSLACGVKAVQQSPEEFAALVLLLADQVAIKTQQYQELLDVYSESVQSHSIVSASFGEHTCPPVIFPRKYWAELRLLSGDRGASQLVKKAARQDQLLKVEIAAAALDIDKKSDLELLDNK